MKNIHKYIYIYFTFDLTNTIFVVGAESDRKYETGLGQHVQGLQATAQLQRPVQDEEEKLQHGFPEHHPEGHPGQSKRRGWRDPGGHERLLGGRCGRW